MVKGNTKPNKTSGKGRGKGKKKAATPSPASRSAYRCIWIQTPNVGELLPASYLAQWAPWRMCAVLLYEDQFVAVVRQTFVGAFAWSLWMTENLLFGAPPSAGRTDQTVDDVQDWARPWTTTFFFAAFFLFWPTHEHAYLIVHLWRCSCACKTAALYCSASLTRHCIVHDWDQEWGLSQGHLYLYSTVLSVPVLYLSCESSLLLLYLSCTYSEFIRYSSGFHGLSAG